MATTLTHQLKQIVRRGRVLDAPAQLAGYDADALGYKSYRPDAVVIPADADELVEVLQSSRELNTPVCMRGAGTSLSGGPVAAQGGVIVHTSNLRAVRTINSAGFWCEVECGVALNQLDAELKPYGLFYPPDPSSGPVCTLGGNVAMNAGGAHCFRYGVTSNYVLGVEVVTAAGGVHRFGGPAGGRGPWREDWKRLMVGSEGTLGAFTRFWLRLLPRPEKAWTLRATYADLRSAEQAIHALVAHASYPVAIELMDPRCVAMVENSPMAVGLPMDSFMILTEIDGPADLVDARVEGVAEILRAAGSNDVQFSDEEAQRQRLWKARKAAGGLMGQISPDFLVQDAVIPKRALADLLQLVYDEADAAGVPGVNVFHAGDGNLHPNFLFDSRRPGELEKVEQISKRLMQRVVEVGGTLSGEHGIGNDKTAYMPLIFGPDTLRLQLAVPRVFNPRHQLNPLKVFADRRFSAATAEVAADPSPPDLTQRPAAAVGGAAASRDPRCFVPFLDVIDGIVCVSAEATGQEIHRQVAPHGLRFPLLVDTRAPLCELVAASGYASASSRFGPLCDNIVGMNWELPSGRVIRLGERVVKTTTGYDLFRFLLSTGQRFGRPQDYVLRLRTDSGATFQADLSGPADALTAAISELLHSCWMHWFDVVDVRVAGADGSALLRVVMNCPAADWPLGRDFLSAFAHSHELVCDFSERVSPPPGLPDVMFKTTPQRVVSLARQLAAETGGDWLALCAPGVVHGYLAGIRDQTPKEPLPPAAITVLKTLVRRHQEALYQEGGEWHSRHLADAPLSELEAAWVEVLDQEFNQP
ncbi:MAG: FAD-linked oxidase C-terminal domain-containing protein [Planctomycetota bacterium]|nr:FAD-linked oxidase C-terminal domain-containing protein [Planctomycetota bacterium]